MNARSTSSRGMRASNKCISLDAADLEAANFACEGVDGQDRREYVLRAFDRL
jgi:hypothetical protein